MNKPWREPRNPVELLRVLHDLAAQYGHGDGRRFQGTALKKLIWEMFRQFADDEVWEVIGAELTEKITDAITRSTKVADAFWIKDGMFEICQGALARVAREGLEAKIPSYLEVSPHGFMWFEKPIRQPMTDAIQRASGANIVDGDVWICAQSWHHIPQLPCRDARTEDEPLVRQPGFVTVLWTTKAEWLRTVSDSLIQNRDIGRAAIEQIGPDLMPVAASGVPYDVMLVDPTDDAVREDLWTEVGPLSLAAMWSLMLDTVEVDTHRVGVPANVRRAYAKRLKHPHVRVVTLRRAKNVSEHDRATEAMSRQWSHRWVVDEFWRHLPGESGCKGAGAVAGEDGEHCAKCGGRITHVVNHVKGPHGLPLQVKERVYNLSR